jgi:hypothetical protein
LKLRSQNRGNETRLSFHIVSQSCYNTFSCFSPITTILIGTSGDRRQFNEFLK